MIDLLQMREKHLLQDRIDPLGPVRDSDSREVFIVRPSFLRLILTAAPTGTSAIFVNTSLTEAFGIANLEAACPGLYVVSTRVGGEPEVLPPDMISFANPDVDG